MDIRSPHIWHAPWPHRKIMSAIRGRQPCSAMRLRLTFDAVETDRTHCLLFDVLQLLLQLLDVVVGHIAGPVVHQITDRLTQLWRRWRWSQVNRQYERLDTKTYLFLRSRRWTESLDLCLSDTERTVGDNRIISGLVVNRYDVYDVNLLHERRTALTRAQVIARLSGNRRKG